MSQLSTDVLTGYRVPFNLLANWLQMPHVDPKKHAEALIGRRLTEWELLQLERRSRVARIWLERWAPEEQKFEVSQSLPAAAHELTAEQRELLRRLMPFAGDSLGAEELQKKIYELSKEIGVANPVRFAAAYLA